MMPFVNKLKVVSFAVDVAFCLSHFWFFDSTFYAHIPIVVHAYWCWGTMSGCARLSRARDHIFGWAVVVGMLLSCDDSGHMMWAMHFSRENVMFVAPTPERQTTENLNMNCCLSAELICLFISYLLCLPLMKCIYYSSCMRVNKYTTTMREFSIRDAQQSFYISFLFCFGCVGKDEKRSFLRPHKNQILAAIYGVCAQQQQQQWRRRWRRRRRQHLLHNKCCAFSAELCDS